jgi:hypothetical protein
MRQRDAGPGWRLAQAALVAAALVTGRGQRRARPGADDADVSAGYARRDMRVGVVAAAMGALLVVLAVVFVLVTSFQAAVTGIPPSVSRPSDLVQGLQGAPEPTPPAPRLQAQPGVDLAAYRAREQQRLHSYRWVDRSTGVVSIPIERAMELVVQRGLPARAAPPPSSGEQAGRSPSTASSGRVEEAWP